MIFFLNVSSKNKTSENKLLENNVPAPELFLFQKQWPSFAFVKTDKSQLFNNNFIKAVDV
jgi:hypothetical protein